MGLDQPALQLVFNVVMITGVTSLLVSCHLLWQDNKKLTLKLRLREQQQRYNSRPPANDTAPAAQGHRAESVPTLQAPVGQQDIRQFVAGRSQEWNVRMAAKSGAAD
jgi:hypothetical protein